MRPDHGVPATLPSPLRAERAGQVAREWAVPAAACALLLAARLWRLDEACLWFDELFGLHAARHGWSELPRFVALDLVHPPLFYLLLKAWAAAGGESVWWLRLLPALASALAAVPLALLGRELRLPARSTNLALALAAASGFLIKYAQEVRMYAPLLLFASCSLWLFARLCRAGGDQENGQPGRDAEDARSERRGARRALFALAAANLLLVYTHYFGWLVVVLELLFALPWARGRVKAFAASVALIALCFAPWAWAVAGAADNAGGGLQQNIGWAARPRAPELFLPYLLLHEPLRFQRHSGEPAVLPLSVVLTLLLFAPALAALGWRELRRARGGNVEGARRGEPRAAAVDAERGGVEVERGGVEVEGVTAGVFALRFLVFFSLAPVVATFALAQLLPQSVWGTRHLVVVAPAYLLLAAHAVMSLRPTWLSLAARLLLGCWLLLAAAGWLARRPAQFVWCHWETLAGQMAREESDSVKAVKAINVYAAEELAAYHLWHALGREPGGDGGTKFRVAVVKNLPGTAEDRAFFLPRGFADVAILDAETALRADDFWLAFRGPASDDEHALLAALTARGYEITRRFEASAQGQTVTMARVRRR